MLVPLNRKKFEELIPLVATADQYRYCSGKLPDFLRRLLLSLAGVVVAAFLWFFLGEGFGTVIFILGLAPGSYWMWGPIFLASRRNAECRKYQYSGFWQGEVFDVFVTEEVVGTEETVNRQGDLVIVENRERCVNLEIGDESGFTTKVQARLRKDHRMIRAGDLVEMVVMSNRPDLSRISKITDVYLPDYNLWVSDYPFLRRDAFIEVSRRLKEPRKRRRSDQR